MGRRVGRLDGKTAIVTGGATGIGEASARLFASEGARVFIANRRADVGEAVAVSIRDSGGSATYVPTDVTDAASVDRLFATAADGHDKLDIVFNVVGISGRRFGDGPIHECTEEGWDVTMDVNVRSMFLMCRAAIAPLRAAGGGSIINMSSVLGMSPAPTLFGTHAYAASKGAIIALSESMAAYYAADRIRVNVLAPALIATPMSERAQDNPRIVEYMKTKQPLTGAMGAPGDCAHAALYLASDESAFVTGVTLPVDGGWMVSEGQIPPGE
ncbi:SDR family oxidoreductase [Candidatus Poribacteria bacterium]|jgi:NAD(P)-dependent dehydrogenase (short-subunit alcohol dehydrogenase family)|nr:SDR family oxidoreductase [Candidatus Poribacteria bacterium]MBT5535711.1 SDR family oxidoreductase [Candidatus Poribacteria bacterium]MBT5714073.1 SDR family oxidoreductase [Candidatus Poribacteria bacterium]MBT7808325.1 SDR family oxidoreductase [Candidatus Poribacteria bacterium]